MMDDYGRKTGVFNGKVQAHTSNFICVSASKIYGGAHKSRTTPGDLLKLYGF